MKKILAMMTFIGLFLVVHRIPPIPEARPSLSTTLGYLVMVG